MDTNDPAPAPETKGKKSTNAIVAERVEAVLRLRIEGKNFAGVRAYAVEQKWGVSDSMLRKYILKSDELLRERTDRNVNRIVRIAEARREAVYEKSVESGDLRTALAALDSLSKLQGIDARREVKVITAELAKLKKMLGLGAGDPVPAVAEVQKETPAEGPG